MKLQTTPPLPAPASSCLSVSLIALPGSIPKTERDSVYSHEFGRAGEAGCIASTPESRLFLFLFFSESMPSLGCLYADTPLNPSVTALNPPVSYSA